jgi:hypothetical protein
MTGGELSAEERAWWRKDAERRRDGRGNTPQNQRVLALLDALDAAEARVMAMRAARDEDTGRLVTLIFRAEDAEAEVARLTAEVTALREVATGDAASLKFWAARAEKAEALVAAVERERDYAVRQVDSADGLSDELEAENRRLSALVEAVEKLADEWIGMDVMRSMDATTTAKRGRELRAALAIDGGGRP